MAKTIEEIICTLGDKEYLNRTEFGTWLNVGKDTIMMWEEMGLKRIMIGGKLYYSKEHFRQFSNRFIQ